MVFPKMFRVKQELEGPTLADIPGAVRATMRTLRLGESVKAGQTVAITSGSRGVANIARITKAVVDELKALGLKPFICPTMGSHGEATAEGQLKILAHYGITEATMGCALKSSMEVVEIGKVKGTTVFCDKNAWGADHIVVVGRIKAHTDFDAEIESGLFKMMAIGLGKQHGAENYHRAGHHYSYGEIFRSSAKPFWIPATSCSVWASWRTATTRPPRSRLFCPKTSNPWRRPCSRKPRPGWRAFPSTSLTS